jgi:protein-S-isoprenylcysteine O-methyltransferase Ste14
VFLVLYFMGLPWMTRLTIHLPGWLRWLGFGVGVVGVLFWTWTQVVLDTQWSAQLQLSKDHQLITSGPYARIRHPLYTSMIGWCLAVSLLTANWIFIGISTLAIAGVILRVPREEQMMVEKFGDRYREYLTHTGRFFPKL